MLWMRYVINEVQMIEMSQWCDTAARFVPEEDKAWCEIWLWSSLIHLHSKIKKKDRIFKCALIIKNLIKKDLVNDYLKQHVDAVFPC